MFSEKFLRYLISEYDDPEIKKMLWDDFHIKHIQNLPILLVKYSDQIVQEFDTIEDIIAFDSEFVHYRDKVLAANAEICAPMPNLFIIANDINIFYLLSKYFLVK